MKRTFRHSPEELWAEDIAAMPKASLGCWRRGYEEGREGLHASGCPYNPDTAPSAARSWFRGHNAGRLDRLAAERAADRPS